MGPMRDARSGMVVLLVLLAVLGGALPASAQGIGASLSAALSVSVPDAATPVPDFTFGMGPSPGPVTLSPVTRSNSSATGSASMTVSGTAEMGRLAGSLSMAASATRADRITGAAGDLNTGWVDTVTVNAPPGTLVRLRARLVFTGSAAASPATPAGTCGPATAFIEASVSLRFHGGINVARDTCGTSSGALDQVLDVDVPAGETVTVEGTLLFSVSGSAADGSGAPLASITAAADVSSVIFHLDVLTFGASLTTGSGVSYASVPPPPITTLTVSGTAFRAGQTLTLGIGVQNPAGQPEADLYAGALLPDGRTAVFLSASGGVAGTALLAHPVGFVPMQVMPPGTTLSQPAFFSFRFPTSGLPAGAYTLFLALVRRGVLLDDRIDPGDVLALDVKTLTFTP